MGETSAPLPPARGVGGRPPPGADAVPTPDPSREREGSFLRFRDDAPHDEPAVTLEAFLDGQAEVTAVRLEAGDDARALFPHLARLALVEVSFPTFRDGRGYSAARLLREAGYEGELRAAGDVLVDQVAFMRRCGFDSFAPEAPIDPVTLRAALGRYADHYQPAADAAVPVWKRRHG